MQVLTAIEHLRKQATQQKINRLKSIKDFLLNAVNEEWIKEALKDRMEICKTEKALIVNIDEFFFDIDSLSFLDFCKINFKGSFNTDKIIKITDLRAF